MLDYLSLEASTEFPAFFTIFYTVLLAFILSSVVTYTHFKTSREIVVSVEFLQSLILVSIVSATVMQAIGDSLARGLGMLGALAIIRYRTTLKTPRNMVFTFAALAAGIACGVYAFVIALTGTIGFCIIAFVLRWSPLSRDKSLMGNLSFLLPIDQEVDMVESHIANHSQRFRNIRFQFGKGKKKEVDEGEGLSTEYYHFEYEMKFENLQEGKMLYRTLQEVEQVSQVKLVFQQVNENV